MDVNFYITSTETQCRQNSSQQRHREKTKKTRMWANAQRDGRPVEHRWRPLFNAAKIG